MLKTILIGFTILTIGYTIAVFYFHGADFISVFSTNVLALNWSGQFNLDFSAYLVLSACWILWRNKFSGRSIIISLMALVFGALVFLPYLLYLVNLENGNLTKVLVGDRQLSDI